MFEVGQKVNWRYTSTRGYGYVSIVAAVVLKINPKTVRIAVYNLQTKRIEHKSVDPKNLTPRQTICEDVDSNF